MFLYFDILYFPSFYVCVCVDIRKVKPYVQILMKSNLMSRSGLVR